jgi:hypothetical protein
MNSMSSMMDDINKYADIWDKALAKGIFDGAPKPPAPIEPEASADFFGQMKTGEYDIDSPLNEGEAKYWKDVSRSAAGRSAYHMPLNEEREVDKASIKKASNRLGSTFNPVYNNTVGKDQDLGTPDKVTKNWGVGGKDLNDLEDLKKRLYKLEVELNKAGIIKAEKGSRKDSESTILKSMDDLKKDIDDLSDKLNGNRTDESVRRRRK